MEIKALIEKLREYLSEAKLASVEEGYRFALEAHRGRVRKSGEPYLEHPLETALIVADLQLDANCVVAALLHDVVEDCGVSLSEIEAGFGAEVGKLVDGVSKVSRLASPAPESGLKLEKSLDEDEARAGSLRKMFVAMAEDIRVVIIKLADRLHNMRTLKALPPQRRLSIAQETMEIYVPLAHRLGIWQLEWELEDLSLRYLQPEKYREITHLIAARREARERYIAQVVRILREELEKVEVRAEVTGRPKNVYSIYTKMKKYEAEGKEFSDIYDLLAVRVLVNEVQDCYNALGVIHSLWHPLPGQFDDYIANPKENMYQSLHTTVMAIEARPLEIQIRTYEMHRIAAYGIAAHWRYKEGAKGDMRFDEKMAWLRQLMEWQRELSIPDFLELVKTDIFGDQVFVYTPKGEIKQLPTGATPLDYAYRIHTELGHRCIGAKVNGKLVPLSSQLRNGDTVEILSTRADRGPSLDWLNPNLGYVKTSHAKEKIRQWFKRQERAKNIEQGKELLEKELRRLGVSLSKQEEIALFFKYETLDEFLAAIGCGDVTTHQIAVKLSAPQEPSQVTREVIPQEPLVESAIQVLGVGDLLTHVARCCNPVPGDEIIGFITRTRGVAVHRKDCPSIANEDEKERLVKVEWGHMGRSYPVPIRVEAYDRVGLLRDISTLVSEEKVNMAGVSSIEHDDGTTSIFLTLQITDIGQLSRLLSKLERAGGVLSVARSGESTKREG